MKTVGLLFLLLCSCSLSAQELPKLTDGSVPLARRNSPGEQHHHLVLENTFVRVYNVIVPARDSTLLHRHEEDYFYTAIGAADLVNAVLDKPEVHAQLKDGEIHFARGGFSHVAMNLADVPFHNVTIALLRPQGAVHNQCGQIVPEPLGDCIKSQVSPGVSQTPEFETEEIEVIRTSLEPKAKHTEARARSSALLVVLDQAELEVRTSGKKNVTLKPGEVLWLPEGSTHAFASRAAGPSRFLLVYFKDRVTR